jgi:hypothetical protein
MTRFFALLCGLALAQASESWCGTERPIDEGGPPESQVLGRNVCCLWPLGARVWTA